MCPDGASESSANGSIGEALLAALLSERRVRVAHRWGSRLLVETDAPRPGKSTPVPFVLEYEETAGGGQHLARAHGSAVNVNVESDERYLYLGASVKNPSQQAVWRAGTSSPQIVLETERGVVSYGAGEGCVIAAVWAEHAAPSLEIDDARARAWRESGEHAAFPALDTWPVLGHRGDGARLRLARVLDGGSSATEPTTELLQLPLDECIELTGELAVTPDGLSCAAGVARFFDTGDRRYGLYVFPTSDAAAGVHVWPEETDLTVPVASPDGCWFACTGEKLSMPSVAPHQRVVFVSSDGGKLKEVDHEDWLIPHAWYGAQDVLCIGSHDGRRLLRRVSLNGGVSGPLDVAGSVSDVTVAGDELLVVTSTIRDAPRVVSCSLTTLGVTLLLAAPDLVGELGPRLTREVYEAADGSTWSAWLCQPQEGAAALPLSVLVWCHGGPVVSWTDWSWRWNPWPFVAEGYAVLMIDPPMSAGYGQEAVERGWSHWLTGLAQTASEQVLDIVAQHPELDGTRLAIMGASLGGWLSLTLATLLPDVRLVVSHAGWVDNAAVARTSDLHWNWLREYGPLGSPGYARENADLTRVSRSTRVMLSYGVRDGHVPVYEGLGVHRALRSAGVDARLMLMPDEAHSVRRYGNAMAWFRWVRDACADSLGGPEIGA